MNKIQSMGRVLRPKPAAIIITYPDQINMSKDINTWIWVTKKRESIPLTEMKRSHIQNSMQWCIRNNPNNHLHKKDGHTYDEWITAFLVKLLDPTVT